MAEMFTQCSSLTNLDLSSFDTNKVTDMGFMFWSCNKLSIDYSHWNVDKVTYIVLSIKNLQMSNLQFGRIREVLTD